MIKKDITPEKKPYSTPKFKAFQYLPEAPLLSASTSSDAEMDANIIEKMTGGNGGGNSFLGWQ